MINYLTISRRLLKNPLNHSLPCCFSPNPV